MTIDISKDVKIIPISELAAVVDVYRELKDGIPVLLARQDYTGVNVVAIGHLPPSVEFGYSKYDGSSYKTPILAQIVAVGSQSGITILGRAITYKHQGRRKMPAEVTNLQGGIGVEDFYIGKYGGGISGNIHSKQIRLKLNKEGVDYRASRASGGRVSGSNRLVSALYAYAADKKIKIEDTEAYILTAPYKNRADSLYVQLLNGIKALTDLPVPSSPEALQAIWRGCVESGLLVGAPFLIPDPAKAPDDVQLDKDVPEVPRIGSFIFSKTDDMRLNIMPTILNMVLWSERNTVKLSDTVAQIACMYLGARA